MNFNKLIEVRALEEKQPKHVLIEAVDSVIVRFGFAVSVLCRKYLHRWALSDFTMKDLSTLDYSMHQLTGIKLDGVN